jgi:peroxiredoxin
VRSAAVPLALAVALALTGCTASADDGGFGGGPGYVDGSGVIQEVPQDQRADRIVLAGTTFDGRPVDLTAMQGKVVVLNAWYANCPPCREEADDLEAARQELRGRGVEFVGLNVRDTDPGVVKAYEEKHKVTYPSLRDGAKALLAFRGVIAPNAVPSTVVLDREGRVAARVSGATTKATIVGLVERVLAGSPA